MLDATRRDELLDRRYNGPMLVANVDYVLSPKTTWAFGQSGVVYGAMVGLPDRIVMLPKNAIGGAGMTVTSTKWSIGDKPLAEALQIVLTDPSTTADELATFLDRHAEGNGDALVVRIADKKAFRVKTGWFSRAVMWKNPEHRGWRALPISGKANALAFQQFYAAKMKG